MKPKPPGHIWADYDKHAARGQKWAFYSTKGEQRANRPDLKPVFLHVLQLEPVKISKAEVSE